MIRGSHFKALKEETDRHTDSGQQQRERPLKSPHVEVGFGLHADQSGCCTGSIGGTLISPLALCSIALIGSEGSFLTEQR